MSKDGNSPKKNNSGQKSGAWFGSVWKKKEDRNLSQKPALGKRIRTWFGLVWKTYITEFEDRVLSSPKRLIKFAGISIIPIIYGVICIVAFWNPIQNIGRAPMVIMDQDQAVVMVQSTKENPTTTTSATNPYFFGPLESISDVGVNDINSQMGYDSADETKSIHQSSNGAWLIPNSLIDTNVKIANLEATILDVLNNQASAPTITLATHVDGDNASFSYDSTNPTFNLKVMSGWTIAKSVLQPSGANESDLTHTFKSNKINSTYQLTNITYLNNQKEIDHQWEGTKYYVQMKIPDGFIEKLLTYMGTMLAKSNATQNDDGTTTDLDGDFLTQLVTSMKPLDVWTTFERNFIFGYYLTTISNVIGGVFIKAIPTILNNALISNTGANISYKGATIKKLIGSSNGEDVLWGIEGSTTQTTLEDATTYVMPDASKLPVNTATNANIRDYTVFGNIDAGLNNGEIDPNATADEVGGKFINLLKTVLNTASNSPLLTRIIAIAKALGISGDAESVIDLLNKVIAVVKGVLGNAPVDQTFVTLNYETYQFTTGQKSLASTKYLSKIVSTIWKQITGTDINYDNFNSSPIFTTKAIMTNDQFVTNLNINIKNNSTYLLGATNISELLPRILAQLLAKNSYGMTNQKLTTMTIKGSKYGLYGIGLGQFFLLIGLYVGSLLQSFIFDRAKRTKKATATSWYVGKWMLFATIALVQGTLVTWVTYAVGWHQLGVSTMVYIWLWLMFSVLIFMTIIQGIWFTIEDEAVGRFCCVIVLVLSLAAGGGTFPALSQFAFFHAISYVVPFTYVLKGLGAIVYGVSESGTTALTTNYIFTQLGILLIYFVLFMTLGLSVGSRLLMRQMNWGSPRGKIVVQAMENLGRDKEAKIFATEKKSHQWLTKHGRVGYKYHWNTLKPDFDEELYFACRAIRLDDGFKWWKQKEHDFVQKPNYSDEESITRNE